MDDRCSKNEHTCGHCGVSNDGYIDYSDRNDSLWRVWVCTSCGYVTPISLEPDNANPFNNFPPGEVR